MAYKYDFDLEQCWYRAVCEKYKDIDVCNHSCIRYMEMHYLMGTSGLPKHAQQPMRLTPDRQRDVTSFNKLNGIKKDIATFVNSPGGLYIYSTITGIGKTSWAIKLMQEYFNQVWCGNGFRCRGLFVHVPSFLTKLKNIIQTKDYDFDVFLQRLPVVDMVIWDDIASSKLSDFDHTNLLTYIDQRVLSGLCNVYTGNVGQHDLFGCVGERLGSRIWNDSITVEFTGRDRRTAV